MKTLRWHSVIGGIAAVVVLVALVLFVLMYARSGALHGSRFRLFVAAPDANNLIKGSDVWLNGQRVGVVRDIAFNDPSAPPDVRVIIETEILNDVRPLIRIDSRANLRSGGTIIGAPVVYINAGTLTAREVIASDTLRSAGSVDLELAGSKFTESMEQVPALFADARAIMTDAQTASNRLGTLMTEVNGAQRGSFARNTRSLMTAVGRGRGSAFRIMSDTALRVGVARSMATMDTLRRLLATRNDEVGRFRRDSTLAPAVRDLMRDVAHLREIAASGSGTIGRTRVDSALRVGLDSAFLELNALLADIKKNPVKYSRVF